MFFLELSCYFDDPADVGNLIPGSSAFSKSSLNIRKFTVYVLLKPGLENFEHYFTSVWDEYNCDIVWAFFGIAFLWDWNENWPFPGLWPLLSFPNLLAIECSTFTNLLKKNVQIFKDVRERDRERIRMLTNLPVYVLCYIVMTLNFIIKTTLIF